jgi:hypothetical protein
MAAWGLERYDLAFAAFERAARSDAAAPALRASAAYWTARSAVRARRPAHYVPWMLQAAQEPRTFYGMIARRTLGLAPGLVWERDVANEAHASALAETAGGWRPQQRPGGAGDPDRRAAGRSRQLGHAGRQRGAGR